MKNTTYTVGQAILTCVTVDDNGNCEAQVDWVQPKRGFEPLIGRCPDLENNFPYSSIRLAGEGDIHPIVFESTGKDWVMKPGKSYAALIGWDRENPKVTFDIKRIGDRQAFENALAELKRQYFATSATPAVKKVVKFLPLAVVEDLTKYRVTYGSKTQRIVFAGTAKKIVQRFTELWKQDPRQNLESDRTVWEKKDDEDRYKLALCPQLPAPPPMLLKAVQKSASA